MVWIDLPFSFPLCYRATGMPGESRGLASVWRSPVLSVTILRMLSQAPPQPGQSVG